MFSQRSHRHGGWAGRGTLARLLSWPSNPGVTAWPRRALTRVEGSGAAVSVRVPLEPGRMCLWYASCHWFGKARKCIWSAVGDRDGVAFRSKSQRRWKKCSWALYSVYLLPSANPPNKLRLLPVGHVLHTFLSVCIIVKRPESWLLNLQPKFHRADLMTRCEVGVTWAPFSLLQ